MGEMMNKSAIVFVINFFIIFAVLEAGIYFLDFGFIENPLAQLEGNLTGLTVQRNQLFLGQGVFEIGSSCSGLVSLSILFAVVFALRKPELKKKIQIFIAGAVLLFVINIFRIFLVLLIGKQFGFQAAELAHEISWVATAAFILIFWYYFTKKIAKIKSFSELV